MNNHVALCGYFSLDYKVDTAGDLIVLSVLKSWLDSIGYTYDVISSDVLKDEVTISPESLNPNKYSAMIFACGPIGDFDSLISLIELFDGVKKIAINVSIVDENSKILDLFDYVFPRDSKTSTSYDMSLEKSLDSRVPVAGLIYVGSQKEYHNQKHSTVEKIVENVLNKLNIASIKIDTKLPYNDYGLKSIDEIISVISKMDLIITTRLHGSILSFKSHVPFISIDPIPVGEKVTKQMRKIDWPFIINVDDLTEDVLQELIIKALSLKGEELISIKEKMCLDKYKIEREYMIKALTEALNE